MFVPVATLTDLPAGKWILNYSVTANWFDAGGLITICRLRVGGTDLSVKSSVLGGSAGSSRVAVLAGTGTLERSGTSTASVECANDADILPDSRPQVVVYGRELTAVRVSELTVR